MFELGFWIPLIVPKLTARSTAASTNPLSETSLLSIEGVRLQTSFRPFSKVGGIFFPRKQEEGGIYRIGTVREAHLKQSNRGATLNTRMLCYDIRPWRPNATTGTRKCLYTALINVINILSKIRQIVLDFNLSHSPMWRAKAGHVVFYYLHLIDY